MNHDAENVLETYAVCIATYKRLQGLRALLEGISTQSIDVSLYRQTIVVVIDNDASGAAFAVVDSFVQSFPFELRYAIEPSRGIANVRNRAVVEAGNVDNIIFIDDDETPMPSWLATLISAKKLYGADVVCGSVTPKFPEGTPAWIVEGWQLIRIPSMTGKQMDSGACGNVIYSRKIHDNIGGFSGAFQLTGGEDSQFFRRAHRAGLNIIYCSEAKAIEWMPIERSTLRWLMKRGYQLGFSHALIEISFGASLKGRTVRLLKGSIHIMLSLARLVICYRRAELVRLLFRLMQGAGMIAGSIGLQYEPYKKI